MDPATPPVDIAVEAAEQQISPDQHQIAQNDDYNSEIAAVSATAMPTDTGASPAADGTAKEKGPLTRLSERAAQSATQVMDALPSSVRPVVEPVVERGRNVGSALPLTQGIEAVDETLQSPEAQRVAGSAVDLVHAVTALTLMVLGATVARLESVLNIERPVPSFSTGEERQVPESELDQHRYKAKELYGRYKTVALAVLSKIFSKSHQSSRSGDTHTTNEGHRPGQYDPHSIDKVVMHKVSKGVNFVKQVGAYSLSQASEFSGPGSSSIVQPAAHYVISKLPEDAKRFVKESRSPFEN